MGDEVFGAWSRSEGEGKHGLRRIFYMKFYFFCSNFLFYHASLLPFTPLVVGKTCDIH